MTRFIALRTLVPTLSMLGLLLVACGSEEEPWNPPSAFAEPVPAPAPTEPGSEFDKGEESILGACAEGIATVKRDPSNVLLLVDRSGSMHIKLPSGQTRWQATKQGLFDLVGALPATTNVGAMLFPQGDAPVNNYCRIDAAANDVKCTPNWPEPTQNARCDGQTYQAGVPSGLLTPAQIDAIRGHVSASDAEFYWGTPLASALRAAVDAQRASKAPGAKSVILLTDGNPTSCDKTGISDDIANVVAAARAGTENGELVRTFVIGVLDTARQAAKAENLSPVAAAGGTGRAANCAATNECFYPVTANAFATDIKKVLEDISLQAFDCTFSIPEPKAGANPDPDSLNVEVKGASGGYVVPRDTGKTNGWDYLPGGKQLQVYGDACKKLAGDGGSSVEVKIVLGCKTQVK